MKDFIKVAMIIQSYYPHVGGAERQLASLAPLLRQQGVKLQVLTRRYRGLSTFEVIGDVPVYRLPVPGPKIIASLTFTLTALPLLRDLQPDVIHAHELLSPVTTAIVAKRLFGIPVVAKVLRGGVRGDLAKLRAHPLERQRLATLRRHVDAFITISQEIDEELAQLGIPSQKRVFVPNGVDAHRFTPVTAAQKASRRTSLGLADVPTVIFTGRLAPAKCLDQLLLIWPAVRASHPEAQLLLLGTGPEMAALQQQAGHGVRFLGPVENVVPYLQAADLFVLPSATEGLSNALLEAMATGLPVVATAVGGTRDVITHRHSGWLVSANEPDRLALAIQTLLGNAELGSRLGQNGRQRVLRDHALPKTAECLRQLYNHVINCPTLLGEQISV